MRIPHVVLSLVTIYWSLVTSATAQAPQLINYQGRLLNDTNLVNGNVGLSLRLFNAPAGGGALYEDSNTVTVVDGLYSTFLGDNTTAGSLSLALTNAQVWLEAAVNGAALTPRERIASVAYALNAWQMNGNAGTAAGTHFLGTTDNQPLELRTFNQRVARFDTATNTAGSLIPNVILGHSANLASNGTAFGSVIGGGGNATQPNRVESLFDTVSGGVGNRAAGGESTVSGGRRNTAAAFRSVVGGGFSNLVRSGSANATIGGGTENIIEAESTNGVIGGGAGNVIGSNTVGGVIGGGSGNTLFDHFATTVHATIGGGEGNFIRGFGWNVIGGGQVNEISEANESVVGGGRGNRVLSGAGYSTVGGGYSNTMMGGFSTISGGGLNRVASGSYATIAGGNLNKTFDGTGAVIGGGSDNSITNSSSYGTIAGGQNNRIGESSRYALIGGGRNNVIDPSAPGAIVVGGGSDNVIFSGNRNSSPIAFIGGGLGHLVQTNARGGVIVGGENNQIGADATHATIGGGSNNIAGGIGSTIPGGHNNVAGNFLSFAAGNRAKAVHPGAFVWGDSSPYDFNSSAVDEFNIRAVGGTRIVSGIDGSGVVTSGVQLAAGSGTWTSLSDVNAKENFRDVDNAEVLEKLAAIPVREWNYKTQDDSIRHIGPTAQDFKAAFGVGETDTGITTVDADGVALAAIQELIRQNRALMARVSELEKRVGEDE